MADGSQVSRAVLQKRRHFELWGICIKLAVRKKHKHVFFDSFQANHFLHSDFPVQFVEKCMHLFSRIDIRKQKDPGPTSDEKCTTWHLYVPWINRRKMWNHTSLTVSNVYRMIQFAWTGPTHSALPGYLSIHPWEDSRSLLTSVNNVPTRMLLSTLSMHVYEWQWNSKTQIWNWEVN